MDNNEFERLVKQYVAQYSNAYVHKGDEVQITEDDVFIVWSCKTIQNNKAMAATRLFDGMYYEITNNGNKREMYLDAYKKCGHKCIPYGYVDE